MRAKVILEIVKLFDKRVAQIKSYEEKIREI